MTPYTFNPEKHYLSSIVLEVDFFNKKNTTQDPFNSDEMAREFSIQFCKQAFTAGMQCVFNFQDKKLLQVVVKVGGVSLSDIYLCGDCIISQSQCKRYFRSSGGYVDIWCLV